MCVCVWVGVCVHISFISRKFLLWVFNYGWSTVTQCYIIVMYTQNIVKLTVKTKLAKSNPRVSGITVIKIEPQPYIITKRAR